MMSQSVVHLLLEFQNLSAFLGALLAVSLAIMARCSLVAPSDTPILRQARKMAFFCISVGLMLACTWTSFDPGYSVSVPMILLVLAIDYLMTVSLISAIRLDRSRRTIASERLNGAR